MGAELIILAGIVGFVLGTVAGVKTGGVAAALPVCVLVFSCRASSGWPPISLHSS